MVYPNVTIGGTMLANNVIIIDGNYVYKKAGVPSIYAVGMREGPQPLVKMCG